MAIFNFRQGIARGQEDGQGNPRYLAKSQGGKYIDLVVSPDPVVFCAAHHDSDYLLTENVTVEKAWGPFTTGDDYWLYWDVDLFTGEITRDWTNVEPMVQPNRPHHFNHWTNQHWFESDRGVMRVWNGHRWVQHVRVFAGKYTNGSTLEFMPFGSQVSISGENRHVGSILFDENNRPVKHFRRNGRGQFFTTESPLHAQFTRNSNFRIEASIIQARASENIPAFHAIGYVGQNTVGLSKNNDPDHPAIGIATENMTVGEIRSFITKGYVQDALAFNWSGVDAGTPVFVGATGKLEAHTGTQPSLQQIGIVVDNITVFVNVQKLIEFTDEANVVPLGINRTNGNLIANPNITGGGNAGGVVYPPGFVGLMGYTFTQATPELVWTINHGANTENVTAMIFNVDKTTVIPHDITVVDANTIVVTFGEAMAGKAQLQIFK